MHRWCITWCINSPSVGPMLMCLMCFPPGIGPVHMNEVQCSGFEKSLTECYFNRDALGCSHEEDAGVRCNVPAMGLNKRVSTLFFIIQKNINNWTGKPICLCLSSASVKWWPQSLRGPRWGAGREERLSGLGHCVQWQLGDNGGHGGLQAAWFGLC